MADGFMFIQRGSLWFPPLFVDSLSEEKENRTKVPYLLEKAPNLGEVSAAPRGHGTLKTGSIVYKTNLKILLKMIMARILVRCTLSIHWNADFRCPNTFEVNQFWLNYQPISPGILWCLGLDFLNLNQDFISKCEAGSLRIVSSVWTEMAACLSLAPIK